MAQHFSTTVANEWRRPGNDRGKRIKAMRQRFHADIAGESQAIVDAANDRGEQLSDAEIRSIATLKKEHEDLGAELKAETGSDPFEQIQRAREGLASGRAHSERPGIVGYDREGHEVRLLRPSDRVAEIVGGVSGAASAAELGQVVRGMVTGQWASPELQAAAGSSTTGGGILLAPQVSAQIIDLSRAKSRVIQAGALTVPMESRELMIARVASNPAAAWRPENAAVATGDFTFDGCKLNARTLGVIAKMPIELAEDAANLGRLVESVLSEVIALEMDRAALLGIGSAEEPLGLKNTTGVLTATSVGSPLYDDFTDAVRDIRLQNGEPTAAILSPRDIGTLEKLRGTANDHFLEPTASFANLNKLYTSQIPTNLGGGTNESLAFVGDFSNLWFGIRTQIQIEASRTASDSTGSAFGNLQVWVRAYIRADVAVVRPKHFQVLSGIL